MKPSHILVFLIVVIIVFGAAKLPDIAKAIGQSAKVLKKEMRELQDDVPPAGQADGASTQTQRHDRAPRADGTTPDADGARNA